MSEEKNILDLSAKDTALFFLKSESYCSIDLPVYINFTDMLYDVDEYLSDPKHTISIKYAKKYKDNNYIITTNKDGQYAWRNLELINPVLYVNLLNEITKTDKWEYICNRFRKFNSIKSLQCASIPVVSESFRKKDKGKQILTWCSKIEQQSLELSLEYQYMFTTDINDCYGSIYTHSISWALHDKDIAKKEI